MTAPPAFEFEGEVVPAALPFDAPNVSGRPAARKSVPAVPGDPQVLSYHHLDKRKKNPEVGLVNEASDSLLVMNSRLVKEDLAGHARIIHCEPPCRSSGV